MKKLCLIFSILISTIASGQYCFKYDVDFAFSPGRYRYSNTMYYTTQNNATPRIVSDFTMFRQELPKTVKGQLNIPAAEGSITKLWTETNREVNLGLPYLWVANCGSEFDPGRTVVLYENTSGLAKVLDWGCLAFPNAVNQKLFQCSMEPCP